MINEILPIGSIVLLKKGIKKLMIIGIQPVIKEEGEEKKYDYLGVLYPEGYIGAKASFLFNHNDINDIIFRGYNNPEREEFISKLEAALEE